MKGKEKEKEGIPHHHNLLLQSFKTCLERSRSTMFLNRPRLKTQAPVLTNTAWAVSAALPDLAPQPLPAASWIHVYVCFCIHSCWSELSSPSCALHGVLDVNLVHRRRNAVLLFFLPLSASSTPPPPPVSPCLLLAVPCLLACLPALLLPAACRAWESNTSQYQPGSQFLLEAFLSERSVINSLLCSFLHVMLCTCPFNPRQSMYVHQCMYVCTYVPPPEQAEN